MRPTPIPPPSATVTAAQSRMLVAQLRRSQIYRDYERAFREATGLPITLRPLEAFDLPHRHDPRESLFCALMAESNHTCAACLQAQKKVEEASALQPTTLKCFAGLCDSAVPVRVGDNLIGFLQTGQVRLARPRQDGFARTARHLRQWGADTDVKRFEEAYFQTRVVTRKQYESILRLLTIFAQHLATLSNQLMVQAASVDTPGVARAKAFIADHATDDVSLATIAQAVNVSTFYFCKTFKKATGLTFTAYLARVRVEKVKNLLLDPHTRISEAAYQSGFQSLSQFNRIFRRIAGESPTRFRRRLGGR